MAELILKQSVNRYEKCKLSLKEITVAENRAQVMLTQLNARDTKKEQTCTAQSPHISTS